MTYDPVYQNDKDTPEHILANTKGKYYWTSTIPPGFPPIFSSLITNDGTYYIRHQAFDSAHSQRPVLCLNNQ